MDRSNVLFELVKLVAQLVGAIAVARLAVQWALRRYKTEKAWERRLDAYVAAVRCIADMRLVIGQWIDEEIEARPSQPVKELLQKERYAQSLRQLEEGIAAGLLLLPESTTKLLAGLEGKLKRARAMQSYVEDLEAQYAILNDALAALIADGRHVLGPEIAIG